MYIFFSSHCRQYEGADEGLVGAELLLQKQEEEVHRLQAHLASRLSRANLYPTDDPLAPAHTSVIDLRDPLYTSSVPLRKPKVCALHVLTHMFKMVSALRVSVSVSFEYIHLITYKSLLL